MEEPEGRWPMTVLLVEDETVNRKILSRILTRMVEVVLEAADGLEALDVLKQRPCALVVTDLTMPRMDGLSLLGEIRARGYKTAVVILSAHNEAGMLNSAEEMGAHRFLFKPVKIDQVKEALDSLGESLGLKKIP